jgi:hypothetical protein
MKTGRMAILVSLILTAVSCAPLTKPSVEISPTSIAKPEAAWTATPTIQNTPTQTETVIPTATPTPSPEPTETSAPTRTPDPSLYTAPDNSFTFAPPAGWKQSAEPMDYPTLEGPKSGGFTQTIMFDVEKSSYGYELYSAFYQDAVKEKVPGIKDISEDFPTTEKGSSYFRWEFQYPQNGQVFHNIVYFYGSNDWILIVTYSRLSSQGSQSDAVVDKAMKTLQFTR